MPGHADKPYGWLSCLQVAAGGENNANVFRRNAFADVTCLPLPDR